MWSRVPIGPDIIFCFIYFVNLINFWKDWLYFWNFKEIQEKFSSF
jgi:hypothetical protein